MRRALPMTYFCIFLPKIETKFIFSQNCEITRILVGFLPKFSSRPFWAGNSCYPERSPKFFGDCSRLSKQKEHYLALHQELNPRTTQVESHHKPLFRDTQPGLELLAANLCTLLGTVL